MTQNSILLLLIFVGSALCWWPAIIEPSLDFPRWILLVVVGLFSSTSILLLNGRGWPAFAVAVAGGSFAGMGLAVMLWPLSDGIANSYAPIAVALGTAAAAGIALTCGLAAFVAVRRWPISSQAMKGALWVVLGLCFAFGPTMFALTTPLVSRRVSRNEGTAAIRFASLKNALELAASSGAADSVCSAESAHRYYSGPPFTTEDWTRILGNYVEEDKYVYMISCSPGKYLLEARPKRPKVYGYGTRTFCADNLGEFACSLEWNR